MTTRHTWHVVILSLVFAAGTYIFDWSAVPIVAIVYGLAAHRSRRPGATAAIAAAVAWAMLLCIAAARGAQLTVFAHQLAGLMQIPVIALIAVTLAFPALLAGCATTLAATTATIKLLK